MSLAATSLTLRAVLKTAASRAGLDAAAPVTAGLSPAARSLAIATAATTAPALVILPTDAEVEQMTADARFFYAGLQGSPEAEVSRAVFPFPSPEVDPYRTIAPHLHVASRERAH